MLRNPFPPARTIYPEIIYNQDDALNKFASAVTDILGAQPVRRSLAVIGGTGSGKSHFLRHCQYHFEALNRPFISVEFLAGTSSAAGLVKDILLRADDLAKDGGDSDFLSAIVSRMENRDNIGPVRQTDLRGCLKSLFDAAQPNFRPADRDGRFTFDNLREVGRRWLGGGALTQTERKYLGVSTRLATATLMIRVMSELLSLARSSSVIEGVLLCIDEVEALFTSGVPTAKIQGFLQDMRYLFDEAVGKESGYSLLVLSASTQRGGRELGNYNYPLFQRLGFEVEAREELHSVGDLDEARDFVNVYIDHEHERAKENGLGKKVSTTMARTLITEDDLEDAFQKAIESRRGETSAITQARLLEALYEIVERKRRSQ